MKSHALRPLWVVIGAIVLIIFGVFMMRWNVVIGGQAFSLSFSGYMHYPFADHASQSRNV